MAHRKKHEADAVTGGVEALASLAGSYKLARQPARLAAGDLLIAVVDGDSVAVRRVHKPRGGRRGGRVKSPHAVYLAQRLAEIEGAVAVMMERSIGSSAVAGVLTAEEDRVLSSGGFDSSPLRSDEHAPVAQSALEYARLLQESLTIDDAAGLLDVQPSRVRQRLGGHPPTLYGLKEGRSWRVPRFQFAGRKPVPGIGPVIAVLPRTLHPVAVQRWFTTPHTDLHADPDGKHPVAPIDWLKTGRPPEAVVELARGL